MNRNTTPSSTSTIVSLTDARDGATRRHDNMVTSAQAAETVFLKRQLESLRRAKAQASKKSDELFQEISVWSEKFEKEKARRTQSEEKLSKERRVVLELKKEMKELRETANKEVREVKSQLENERKKWAERRLFTNRKSKGVVQTSASTLEDRIKYLEEENARLELLTKPHCCEGIYEEAQRQIDDALVLLGAAEAEVEELRYLESVNEELMEKYDADLQQIEDLICELECCKGKVREPENEIATADEQRNLESPTPPNINVSATTNGAYTTPIESWNETAETDYLRQSLHDVETENENLIRAIAKLSHEHCDTMVELDRLSENILFLHHANLELEAQNDGLASQLQTALQHLRAKNEDTRRDHPIHHRTYTTFSDPGFATTLPTPDSNVHIPITIRLYEKCDWSLLYHVQRTLFRISPLQVDGPSYLVREFVARMQNADAEFQETKERVERLERAFEVGVQEMEVLKRGRWGF